MKEMALREPTTTREKLRARRLRWTLLALGVVAVIIVLRLGLGTLFGGTRDQQGYVLLFEMTRRGLNPYVASKIIAWPPFWWGLVAFWSSQSVPPVAIESYPSPSTSSANTYAENKTLRAKHSTKIRLSCLIMELLLFANFIFFLLQ
jgi:hypothetical protein